jgi:hypothetical protein
MFKKKEQRLRVIMLQLVNIVQPRSVNFILSDITTKGLYSKLKANSKALIKGTVSRDFLSLVFSPIDYP